MSPERIGRRPIRARGGTLHAALQLRPAAGEPRHPGPELAAPFGLNMLYTYNTIAIILIYGTTVRSDDGCRKSHPLELT